MGGIAYLLEYSLSFKPGYVHTINLILNTSPDQEKIEISIDASVGEMNQYINQMESATLRSGFFVLIRNLSPIGRVKVVLSIKKGILVDTKGEMATLSMEQGIFVDKVLKLMISAIKQGFFLEVEGK